MSQTKCTQEICHDQVKANTFPFTTSAWKSKKTSSNKITDHARLLVVFSFVNPTKNCSVHKQIVVEKKIVGIMHLAKQKNQFK